MLLMRSAARSDLARIRQSFCALMSETEPRSTQFQAEAPSSCRTVDAPVITARLPWSHVWCSVYLVNGHEKALFYIDYTAGCFRELDLYG